MHLVETYAVNCGAKIGRPFIYTSFFPIPFERYITFHSDCVGNARNYDYLQDVINILSPVLSTMGIQIIQVGGPQDREYSGCVSIKGQTNINQLAYVVKNSMLHFGADSFPIHLAGGFDVPLVAMFSTSYINCVRPYFGSKDKQIFFSSYDRHGWKPSYLNEENPKTINSIKPEEIADAVFKLLNIEYRTPFESIFFGKKYTNFSLQESLANSNHILFNPEMQVEISTDIPDYSEEALINQLSRYKKSVVIMDKPINLNILRQFKAHLLAVVFKVTDTDYKDFIKELESIGTRLILVSELANDKIQELKIKYYEFGILNPVEPPSEDKINEIKKDIGSLFYRSSKIISSNGKFYYGPFAASRGIPMNSPHEYQKVVDDPLFWKNLDFYTIIKMK